MSTAHPGSTSTVSVSMPTGLLTAVRDRAGQRNMSAYITEAVRHRLEMDGLAEIVAEYESAHEPLTEAEIEEASRDLFGSGGAINDRGSA
ncbi:hypothetical protein ACFWPH_11390 [Nocardia sp. NPDC058499]|uniref:hypothetical protein n=1 Tax=Nocardia sp. NPDC058499 TaxID=3346530 RepID=UPI003660AAD0